MNYEKIYKAIVENRKSIKFDGYTELHHIIPRSLGGSNDKDNLVALSAREHFICHLLLVKIHKNTSGYYKMVKAFMMMFCASNNQNRYVSKNYAWLREEFSKAKSIEQSGRGNSQYGKKTYWIWHELFGKRRIDRDLLEDYLQQGWFYGLTHKQVKQRKVKDKKDYAHLNDWYLLYQELGFTEFCKKTGYDKSKPNLVQMFSKYVKDFTPQNGKRRGVI